MPASTTNFDSTRIMTGPSKVWIDVAVPAGGARMTLDNTTGTPESVANPNAKHIGLTEAGVTMSVKTEIQSFEADELTAPWRQQLSNDDGASVDSPCVFGFEVAVTGTKPEELAEELRKRVAAVRMMAISSPADLVAGIVSVSKLIIEFGAAQFEQVREHETTAGLYYRSATFTITLRYIQTGG
ncbi:MAG: hypothetical protein AB7U82_27650 [Blastocatellales bacterium]